MILTDVIHAAHWADRRRIVLIWAHRVQLVNKLMLALLAAAVIAGIVTYGALSESPLLVGPGSRDPNSVLGLLIIDLIIFMMLGLLIGRRVAQLIARQRQGRAGSRLHLRVVAVFGALAVTPAILVAVFAAVFFVFGVQSWFSDRVRTAVTESQEVAQAYLNEHQQVIRGDILAMANDFNREGSALYQNPQRLQAYLQAQTQVRSLTEAVVFDGDGNILARSGFSFAMEFETIPDALLDKAKNGDVVLIVDDNEDRVRALVQLDQNYDVFLFVGRLVDQKVLDHMQNASGAVAEYKALESERGRLQVLVTAIFVVVALLMLAVAVWVGLTFANRLLAPISALIDASERLAKGETNVQVAEHLTDSHDELSKLSRSFNRMTTQLVSQQQELVAANRQLDTRRRFTEAVLSGVSAGVIGTNAAGEITLPNQAAVELLGFVTAEDLVGKNISDVLPEISNWLPERNMDGQIEVKRDGQPTRTLLVRLTTEFSAGIPRGHVVTFDDVSELVGAQRKAAWADVARRIAHEIKNPLTPIQLAAERLQKKYLDAVEDKTTFAACVETIVRQVQDIGRMVDEFSSFARMPAPVMRHNNLYELVRQTVFLMRNSASDITVTTHLPEPAPEIVCDARLISQALTNILKNAAESIEGREGPVLTPGQIDVTVERRQDGCVDIVVRDNGRGLPSADRDKLTEPYVTTRAKGTGLGLAIVRKIMEDHHGALLLQDNDVQNVIGAKVTLRLPLHPEAVLQVA